MYAFPVFTCDLNIAKRAPCYLMLSNLMISLSPQSDELISHCSDCTSESRIVVIGKGVYVKTREGRGKNDTY